MNNTEELLTQALKDAKAKIVEQDKLLRQLTTKPREICVVSDILPNSAIVRVGDKFREIEKPSHIKTLRIGTWASLAETGQIIEEIPIQAFGETVTIRKVNNDTSVEVLRNGEITTVNCGLKVANGDQVVLDPHGSIVIQKLAAKAKISGSSLNVKWEDIGGLQEEKQLLRKMVEDPIKYKEIYAKYQRKSPKGILLYGPPGCGKTLLCKAVATALARLHEKDGAPSSFISVKGPEVLDLYVGVSEANVRNLFDKARAHKKEHGYPATIVIDEADSLLSARQNRNNSIVGQTIVPTFLAEMDGMDESSAIVIILTNLAHTLDPAVVRDGRIDRKVKIKRPDQKGAAPIFKVHLKGRPLHDSIDDLTKSGVDGLFSDENVLDVSNLNGERKVRYLRDIISGAMIANIVELSVDSAIRREQDTGKAGLRSEDILSAISLVHRENLDINHQDQNNNG